MSTLLFWLPVAVGFLFGALIAAGALYQHTWSLWKPIGVYEARLIAVLDAIEKADGNEHP